MFPTNPGIADVVGDMGFDFDTFRIFDFGEIPIFQIFRFPESQIGPGFSRLGPFKVSPDSVGMNSGMFLIDSNL